MNDQGGYFLRGPVNVKPADNLRIRSDAERAL